MHFTGNWPPSTCGSTASITARARPSCGAPSSCGGGVLGSVVALRGMRLPFQNDGRQWGQGERHRPGAAVARLRYSVDAPQVAPARSPVVGSVAVEDFL